MNRLNPLRYLSNKTVAGFAVFSLIMAASPSLAAEAVLVKDIGPGVSSGIANGILRAANLDGVMYFPAYDGTHSVELWRADGTYAYMVKDLVPAGGINGHDIFTFNGKVYFGASPAASIACSDGTAQGTVTLSDLPTNSSDWGRCFFERDGFLYYFQSTNVQGQGTVSCLIRTGGTSETTSIIKTGVTGVTLSPSPSRKYKGINYYAGYSGALNIELWRTDGTDAGTYLVKDIWPMQGSAHNSRPRHFVEYNGDLYFVATTGNGNELWKTDGTTDGTVRALDINPAGDDKIEFLAGYNGSLYFAGASNGSNVELWKSDGTLSGSAMLKDINPGPAASNPQFLVASESTLYFSANVGLWQTDGTAAGTVQAANPATIPGPPQALHIAGYKLYFTASTPQLGHEIYFINIPAESAVAEWSWY